MHACLSISLSEVEPMKLPLAFITRPTRVWKNETPPHRNTQKSETKRYYLAVELT